MLNKESELQTNYDGLVKMSSMQYFDSFILNGTG